MCSTIAFVDGTERDSRFVSRTRRARPAVLAKDFWRPGPPAGTHRPTTRRGSGIAQPSRSRGLAAQSAWRAEGAGGPAGSLPRVPGAPRVRAGPSHRHARRAAGDRGPWVSLPLRATIPEGNTVGQHADVDVGPSHRAPGLRARGHRRIDAGDIDAGETWGT